MLKVPLNSNQPTYGHCAFYYCLCGSRIASITLSYPLPRFFSAVWNIQKSYYSLNSTYSTSVSETIRKPPLVKAQNALKKIKYGEFSIWQMEFLHPAMWHNNDIDFARWLHPAMWHVALESWQWIHQVAAPCNVIRGSGMTCHGIRPNVRHIGILHLVSILTI